MGCRRLSQLYVSHMCKRIFRFETLIKQLSTKYHFFKNLQMLLFPNAPCCSLYERNCVCAVTKICTKYLPANNFCQLLRVTRKRSCTSAGNAQAQLHFRDDQQRAFGISNISNCPKFHIFTKLVIFQVYLQLLRPTASSL